MGNEATADALNPQTRWKARTGVHSVASPPHGLIKTFLLFVHAHLHSQVRTHISHTAQFCKQNKFKKKLKFRHRKLCAEFYQALKFKKKKKQKPSTSPFPVVP